MAEDPCPLRMPFGTVVDGERPGESLTARDFDVLYRNSWSTLVRLATLLLGDRAGAEDVVQDAFARTYLHLDRLRGVPGATAYVRTAVVNGARSALRHRRVVITKSRSLYDGDAGPLPGDELLAAEEHREVMAALADLPRRQREVLVLRYWSELSEADIAATLGISRGAVKSTASRGIAALDRRLGGRR